MKNRRFSYACESHSPRAHRMAKIGVVTSSMARIESGGRAMLKDGTGFDSPGMRGASQEAQRKQQKVTAVLKRLSESSQGGDEKAKHSAAKKKAP